MEVRVVLVAGPRMCGKTHSIAQALHRRQELERVARLDLAALAPRSPHANHPADDATDAARLARVLGVHPHVLLWLRACRLLGQGGAEGLVGDVLGEARLPAGARLLWIDHVEALDAAGRAPSPGGGTLADRVLKWCSCRVAEMDKVIVSCRSDELTLRRTLPAALAGNGVVARDEPVLPVRMTYLHGSGEIQAFLTAVLGEGGSEWQTVADTLGGYMPDLLRLCEMKRAQAGGGPVEDLLVEFAEAKRVHVARMLPSDLQGRLTQEVHRQQGDKLAQWWMLLNEVCSVPGHAVVVRPLAGGLAGGGRGPGALRVGAALTLGDIAEEQWRPPPTPPSPFLVPAEADMDAPIVQQMLGVEENGCIQHVLDDSLMRTDAVRCYSPALCSAYSARMRALEHSEDMLGVLSRNLYSKADWQALRQDTKTEAQARQILEDAIAEAEARYASEEDDEGTRAICLLEYERARARQREAEDELARRRIVLVEIDEQVEHETRKLELLFSSLPTKAREEKGQDGTRHEDS